MALQHYCAKNCATAKAVQTKNDTASGFSRFMFTHRIPWQPIKKYRMFQDVVQTLKITTVTVTVTTL